MTELQSIVLIVMGAILVENFVLSKFLGICPFLGVSKNLNTALGMSGAVVFVMALASLFTWLIQNYVLIAPFKNAAGDPLWNLGYLQTLAFILVIAALVQFVEMFLKKFVPPLFKALGVYLPLITTNCAVLGAALLNLTRNYDLLQSIFYGIGAGLGFTLALVIFSGVREKIEKSDIPDSFKGVPIALVAAALVSMSFFGFQGLFG